MGNSLRAEQSLLAAPELTQWTVLGRGWYLVCIFLIIVLECAIRSPDMWKHAGSLGP